MKFKIFYAIRGPGGQQEAPNSVNPVESEDLPAVLKVLSEHLPPLFGGAKVIGIRIIQED